MAALCSMLAWTAAQSAVVSLVPSQAVQDYRTELTADLVVLNTGNAPEELDIPAQLSGRLSIDLRDWPIALHSDAPALRISIDPGQFFRRTYRFVLPEPMSGRAVIEIAQPGAARAVLDVRNFSAGEQRTAESPPPAARIERSFASRFMFHEPIYFIYGMEAPTAKFQFSFKYRLIGQDSVFGGVAPSPRGFYLAFTQRSLWDVQAESSPFYDTSYMPEVDYTQPVRIPWIELETYLQAQYFTGHGESLRFYDQKSSVWRLGIGFVR